MHKSPATSGYANSTPVTKGYASPIRAARTLATPSPLRTATTTAARTPLAAARLLGNQTPLTKAVPSHVHTGVQQAVGTENIKGEVRQHAKPDSKPDIKEDSTPNPVGYELPICRAHKRAWWMPDCTRYRTGPISRKRTPVFTSVCTGDQFGYVCAQVCRQRCGNQSPIRSARYNALPMDNSTGDYKAITMVVNQADARAVAMYAPIHDNSPNASRGVGGLRRAATEASRRYPEGRLTQDQPRRERSCGDGGQGQEGSGS